MERSNASELLDADNFPEDVIAKTYRELWLLHAWLGNTFAVMSRLRKAVPVASSSWRVLDIGCAQGALLMKIQAELGCDVIGFDLRPAPGHTRVPILAGDAVTDPLPRADVAISVVMAHHLTPCQVRELIVNTGRACNRLILLDLVRHPLPLLLFRTFVAPLLSPINAADGLTSVERAFTPMEMREIAERAVSQLDRPVVTMRHSVAPLWIRQIVDITWES